MYQGYGAYTILEATNEEDEGYNNQDTLASLVEENGSAVANDTTDLTEQKCIFLLKIATNPSI